MNEFGINATRATVAYLQANGQVENDNHTILDGIKRKLVNMGRSWLEELPYVLWAHRTTLRRVIGETPFSLTYGFEAQLPIKVRIPTIIEESFVPKENEKAMIVDMKFHDEK